MVSIFWGYLDLRIGGYGLFRYNKITVQTPKKAIRHITICSAVMYLVYGCFQNHHVFLLGVISYTRDYDASLTSPENLAVSDLTSFIKYGMILTMPHG
jgi:hypothetical protein